MLNGEVIYSHRMALRRGITPGLAGGVVLSLPWLFLLSTPGEACTVILCSKSIQKNQTGFFTSYIKSKCTVYCIFYPTHQRAGWYSCCLGPVWEAGSSWSVPCAFWRVVSPGTSGGLWCSALSPRCRSPARLILAHVSSTALPASSVPPQPEPVPLPRNAAPVYLKLYLICVWQCIRNRNGTSYIFMANIKNNGRLGEWR